MHGVATGISASTADTAWPDDSIVMINGQYAWEHGKNQDPVLSDINLKVPKGSLCAVVGAAGSGKSSLLGAVMGEMNRMHVVRDC